MSFEILVWSENLNAITYDAGVTADTVCDGDNCSYTPDYYFAGGHHRWWLNARGDDCDFEEQPGGRLLDFDVTPCPGPLLYSPNGNTPYGTNPEFTWQDFGPGMSYQIMAFILNADGGSDWVSFASDWYDSSICNGTTCAATPPSNFVQGTGRWYLNTRSFDCGYLANPGGYVLPLTVVSMEPR